MITNGMTTGEIMAADPSRLVTCRKCGDQVEWQKRFQHHQQVHGAVYGKPRGPRLKRVNHADPALARLQELQAATQAAVRDLELERDGAHKRLLELDDLIARYKAMLIANTR